jgi:hypothetical protein
VNFHAECLKTSLRPLLQGTFNLRVSPQRWTSPRVLLLEKPLQTHRIPQAPRAPASQPVPRVTQLLHLLVTQNVIADTFSRLGSIPHRETIYPSNFPEGTLNVHFSGFNFNLNFHGFSKVFARSEMSPSSSRVLTIMSSTYASMLRPSCEYRHHCIPL